ncbi:hypothetical protein K435DRAFT_858318 [Dendrothele bispora CBS 962.96]|uniref:Uncharacterized protein n=1 Tax=Dendrothele bispora (strain CBS 962.96) TaxID=1314807 RepID=A0A4S8M3F1_DENBC|nr:hypothetical protein K435DRAFT_858318 [Dendrothele bispora CBS 962.96]
MLIGVLMGWAIGAPGMRAASAVRSQALLQAATQQLLQRIQSNPVSVAVDLSSSPRVLTSSLLLIHSTPAFGGNTLSSDQEQQPLRRGAPRLIFYLCPHSSSPTLSLSSPHHFFSPLQRKQEIPVPSRRQRRQSPHRILFWLIINIPSHPKLIPPMSHSRLAALFSPNDLPPLSVAVRCAWSLRPGSVLTSDIILALCLSPSRSIPTSFLQPPLAPLALLGWSYRMRRVEGPGEVWNGEEATNDSGLGEGEAPDYSDYSDYESDLGSPTTLIPSIEKKGKGGLEWTPGCTRRAPSQRSGSQGAKSSSTNSNASTSTLVPPGSPVTTTASSGPKAAIAQPTPRPTSPNAATPPAFLTGLGAVPATPSLIKDVYIRATAGAGNWVGLPKVEEGREIEGRDRLGEKVRDEDKDKRKRWEFSLRLSMCLIRPLLYLIIPLPLILLTDSNQRSRYKKLLQLNNRLP